jgi:AcrR family transcriptional regulator
VPPPVELIARRAGVSASSLFRYFETLDDLLEVATDRFFERYADLFLVPAAGEGHIADRIERLAKARVALYETIAPVARMSRSRSVDHPRLATALHEMRGRLAVQIRHHFAAELAPLGRAGADDLVGTIATLTSFESWDQLVTDHGRSRSQIVRGWNRALAVLLEDRA